MINTFLNKIYLAMKTIEMKKILIALDYDPTAQKVAETGFSLAKNMGATVILLHVISDAACYTPTENIKIMGFSGCKEIAPLPLDNVGLKKISEQYLDKTKQHLGDKTIETTVKIGDIAESIVKTAKSQHVDFIVMGSHSRKWLENLVIGSVTEKVLHYTTIPVLIVPTRKLK